MTIMGLAALIAMADKRADFWWGFSDIAFDRYERERDGRDLDRMVRADAIASGHAGTAERLRKELNERCGT